VSDRSLRLPDISIRGAQVRVTEIVDDTMTLNTIAGFGCTFVDVTVTISHESAAELRDWLTFWLERHA
jgi:hypothetical protein